MVLTIKIQKPFTNVIMIVLYSFSKDPLILVSVLMLSCDIDTVTANSRIFRVFNLISTLHWGADKSLAQPTSRCMLFDGENILFDASLVIQGVPGGM